MILTDVSGFSWSASKGLTPETASMTRTSTLGRYLVDGAYKFSQGTYLVGYALETHQNHRRDDFAACNVIFRFRGRRQGKRDREDLFDVESRGR